ncbi:hypothetical protein T4C_868, partial [Trichinella pseudospiralis]
LRETVVTVCMCSPLLRRLLDFITDNIRPKNKSEILSSLGYQLCDRHNGIVCILNPRLDLHHLLQSFIRVENCLSLMPSAQRYSGIEDGEEKKLKMQITPSKKFIDGTKQIETKQEIWTMKKRKSENADGTKQIADDTKQIKDDTKQNFRMKTYGICGFPWVPIL